MAKNNSKFEHLRKFNGNLYQLLTKLEKEDEERIEEIKQQFREKGYTDFRIATSTIVNTQNKALYGRGKFKNNDK